MKKILILMISAAAEYVASGIDLKNRPLLCPDGTPPGMKLILR